MKKRLLSILLMCCMVLTLLPTAAHADDETWLHWKVFCETCNKEVVNRDDAKYVYENGTYCRYVTKCPDCHSELVSDMLVFHCHSGSGTPTCTTGIICDNCGHEYGALGHSGSWTSNGDGTHTRTCQRVGCGVTETVNCSGGTATCIAKAVCRDCGAEYGEKDLNNHTGGTATCTKKAVCKDCKQEYGDLDPNKHSVIPATCIAPATCKDCGKELEPINPNHHYGGEATCITKAICELCGNEYGETDPDNHDYEVTVTKEPTCIETGSANYVCKNCNDSGTETIPATGHRFFYSDLKEVSTAEGSGIELECDLCHVKKTVPLYAVECKAGETYTDDYTINVLIDLVSWSDKYTVDFIGENGFTVKTSAGKLIFTGEVDGTGVSAFHAAEGVTSEDSDTAVVWGDGAEPEYGVKCSFIAKDYTITYDLDGGAAEGNPTGYNADTGTFTLKNPTRPGYTFTGWSGTGLTGENNLTVTIKKGSTGDRAYKAHWLRR